MTADADIQVWLETVARTQPEIIVPYVQSSENTTLRYRLSTVREGRQGRAQMSQAGTVKLIAHVATPLVRMSVTRNKPDSCLIEITLVDDQRHERSYTFECPKAGSVKG